MLDALALLGRVRTRALEASGLDPIRPWSSTGAELDLEVKAYAEVCGKSPNW